MVYGCFYAIMTELNSCHREYKDHSSMIFIVYVFIENIIFADSGTSVSLYSCTHLSMGAVLFHIPCMYRTIISLLLLKKKIILIKSSCIFEDLY